MRKGLSVTNVPETSRDKLIQFIKYGLAGGTATAVNMIIFYALSLWVLPALTAEDPLFRFVPVAWMREPAGAADRAFRAAVNNGIGFVLSNMVAYVLNVLWVFKPGRHSRLVEVGLFYLVAGASFIIGSLLQYLLIDYGKISTTIAFMVNIFTALILNYAIRKRFIFKG